MVKRLMATFAETMLSKYETLLQTSAGLDTVPPTDRANRKRKAARVFGPERP